MSSFTSGNQREMAQFVLSQLKRHKHMVLSTIDDQGAPWSVYVGFVLDDKLRFIWQSRLDTEHSRHLRARPQVAVGVFSKTDDVGDFGFYCKAEAQEVVDEDEIRRSLHILARQRGKPTPDARRFMDDGLYGIYIATVNRAWMNDSSHIKREIDLTTLRDVITEISEKE